jgi:hypothetical protein
MPQEDELLQDVVLRRKIEDKQGTSGTSVYEETLHRRIEMAERKVSTSNSTLMQRVGRKETPFKPRLNGVCLP